MPEVNMAKDEDKIQVEGLVIEALPGTQFKVRIDNGHEVLAYLSCAGGNVPLRPHQRPDCIPSQEILGSP